MNVFINKINEQSVSEETRSQITSNINLFKQWNERVILLIQGMISQS